MRTNGPMWVHETRDVRDPHRKKWEVTFYQPSKRESFELEGTIDAFIKEKEAAGDMVLVITSEDIYLTKLDWARMPMEFPIQEDDLPVF